MQVFLIAFLALHLFVGYCESDNGKKSEDTDSEDVWHNFKFIREEPANELGIRAKVIAQIYRAANQRTEEHRINREFLPDDILESLLERCKSKEKSGFVWSGCVSNSEGLHAFATWGQKEPKNKTITYLELTFEPFTRTDKDGDEELCALEEVYKPKAYVVLHTFHKIATNGTLKNDPDDVGVFNQLDTFGEHFLDLFGANIERDKIYNFGIDEYYDRDPPYECFLAISSSQSKEVIEKKCDFFCMKIKEYNKEEMKEVFNKAKEKAGLDELEVDFEIRKKKDKKLSVNERVEL